MSYRIAVIGGGWYGCHLASTLKALDFSVILFEKNERLLNEASGNNQFRLHVGFHYPRHAGTRIQSRDGFSRFLERYGSLSKKINENIYAVPKDKSLIDFDTYKLIMTATGIPYQTIEKCSIDLKSIDGLLKVDERVLLIEKSRSFFKAQLNDVLQLSTKVDSVRPDGAQVLVNGERFDYVIDATWGHFSSVPIQSYYEPTILLYFEGAAGLPALTFVDGPLYSIYPTEEPMIYTLSSVPHTPVGQFDSVAEAVAIKNDINSNLIAAKLSLMTDQASVNIPQFKDLYKFLGPQISIKTKPVGSVADRSCYVGRKGRVFTVMSGKIDTIFFAAERILSMIEADGDVVQPDVKSLLRSTIENQTSDLRITG